MERRGVLDDGGGRPVADLDALIHSAIRSWQDGLIDLTAANPLLNLEPGTTATIEISRPAADDVLTRLRTGGTFTFRSLKPWPDAAAPAGPGPATGTEPATAAGGGGDAGDGQPGAAHAGLPAPAPY